MNKWKRIKASWKGVLLLFLVGWLVGTLVNPLIPWPEPRTIGTFEAEVSANEYPYRIVVVEFERGLSVPLEAYLVGDYEVVVGGIAFENYYRTHKGLIGYGCDDFVYYEQAKTLTGRTFRIEER